MIVIFRRHQKSRRVQVGKNLFSTFVTVKSRIFSEPVSHRAGVGDNFNLLQIVAKSHFKIVGVVSRCDFNRARAEFFIDVAVGEQRDFTVDERQD